ncbi:MAG: response regulator [Pelatocladus maniniholoensis HA4357-MV3]|jgi:two-component system cell cycle sensor histidine kinase/response regulator CckA|uniref:histidine kinase n=1 Tax=Pelatocladus maniniholoensis HA4357-MV3 TaxID=1117104 RepID=A0A9E3LTT8_9NOST|nr:response regulator [Pelatocladus maniniholoensis HA4357-MV3]
MKTNLNQKGVILIVDDTPTNLEILFDFLGDSGFTVLVAEDGESAIARAEYAPPDLILLDIIMPGMDGFETCRCLKANESTKDIPIIFMTALSDTVDKVKGLNLGAVDYITKPLQHEEVLARIELHLKLQNLTKALQEQNLHLETEISKRLQVEEELRHHTAELAEWKNRCEAVIQASGQFIYDWNSDTDEISYDGDIEKILGYSHSEMSGGLNRFLELIHPEDRNLFNQEVNRVLSTKEPFYLEYRLCRKNGTWITVEDKGYFFLDSRGNLNRMVGFVADISDRKQAEQKICEQAALLDITTDAILLRDWDNTICFWNQGAEHLYGWKTQEAIGKNANQLLYKPETVSQLQNVRKTLVESDAWQGELHQITKEGKAIIVASRWTLMRDQDGQPKSILTVNTDITEKKLLESQFLRAQRLESVGTLAGGIAHDLNNILTPILTAAQLLQLKQPNIDERSQQMFKTIESNAKRGAALVKQVLHFTRGVEGKRTIVQVGHLCSEIKPIVEETFPKSIEFSTNIPPDLWAVIGDATNLHQVIMNLVVNARDAMPNGGTLSISAENIFIDEQYARMNIDACVGPYIAITVADTGIGMQTEILDRMFEPFFTTKEIGKGTGLGLSTVRGIIKGLGGFVNVFSTVGRGTKFKVFLPAVEATATPLSEDLELLKGNGELVLVVDDEARILETTKISLETYNYQVMIAKDGIEAIALYAQYQDQISTVLMDMMMPSMDGVTTSRTLQKIDPLVKIIAVSGLAANEKLAGNPAIKAFIAKPYTTKELLQTLHRILYQEAMSVGLKKIGNML